MVNPLNWLTGLVPFSSPLVAATKPSSEGKGTEAPALSVAQQVTTDADRRGSNSIHSPEYDRSILKEFYSNVYDSPEKLLSYAEDDKRLKLFELLKQDFIMCFGKKDGGNKFMQFQENFINHCDFLKAGKLVKAAENDPESHLHGHPICAEYFDINGNQFLHRMLVILLELSEKRESNQKYLDSFNGSI
jgi:hypothetical protein